MSMPERRDDSLFLAARTGDLGGVDVILSFALLLDTKEINQSTRYLALYCVRATATTVLDGEWLWRRLCSVHRIGILGGHAAPRGMRFWSLLPEVSRNWTSSGG